MGMGRTMRKAQQRQLSVLTLLAVFLGTASALRCLEQRHLSDPESHGSLPPLVASIVVSSYASKITYPINDFFAFSFPFNIDSWCSKINPNLPQHVTLNLTEPLVIHGLLSGGYSSSSSFWSYVDHFSLEYSETDNGAVIADHLPEVFSAAGPDEVTLILLPQPIVAKTLYFHALDFSYSNTFRFACWSLALFGCTLAEAEVEPSLTACPTPSPSSLDSHTPTPTHSPVQSSATPPVSERGGASGEKSSRAVNIAVSTSVVTILMVAVMVGVGVALCWAISHGHILSRYKIDTQQDGQNTLKKVENALYTTPRNGARDVGYEQIRESTSSGEGLLPSDDTSPAVFTPSINESQQPSGVYEPVQPVEGVSGSMMDNAAYLPSEVAGVHSLSNVGYEPVTPPPHSSAASQIVGEDCDS